tara:strand:+ start:91 stop:297 length:207 start_codon:yes stop_codon:yes gene_type:complete
MGAVKLTGIEIGGSLSAREIDVEALANSIHPVSGLSWNLGSSSLSQPIAKIKVDNKKIENIFFIVFIV